MGRLQRQGMTGLNASERELLIYLPVASALRLVNHHCFGLLLTRTCFRVRVSRGTTHVPRTKSYSGGLWYVPTFTSSLILAFVCD